VPRALTLFSCHASRITHHVFSWAILLACLAAPSLAGEKKEAAPPPPTRVRYRLWLAPVYVVVGLPRDVLDAPSKMLSSIPLFNRVLIVPLAVLNGVTTTLSWSFTREGVEGGYEAWVACLKLPRSRHKHMPAAMVDRPWWKNYFPNWRSFGVIERVPVEPEPE